MRVSEALPKTSEPARPRGASERTPRRDGTEPDVAGFAALLHGASRAPEPRPEAVEDRRADEDPKVRIDEARGASQSSEAERTATETPDDFDPTARRVDAQDSGADEATTAGLPDGVDQTSTTESDALASLVTADDEVADDSATTLADLEIAPAFDEKAEAKTTSPTTPTASAAKTETAPATTLAADTDPSFADGLGDASTDDATADLTDSTAKDGPDTSRGVDVRSTPAPTTSTNPNTATTPAAQDAGASKIDAPLAATETKSSGTTPAVVLPEEAQRIFEQIKEQYRPGTNRLVFRLDPPEFGKLEIRLKLQRGRLVGEVVAESDSIARLLERDLDRLKSSLESTGAAVDQWSFQSKEDAARFQKEGRFESRSFDLEGRAPKAVAKSAPVASHTAPTSASERLNVMV